MTTIVYARVSSKEQKEEGYSIEAQQKLLREYANKNGLLIVKEFVDVETAKRAGRDSFEKMIQFLKDNHSIKTILVEKTDRLYRNFRDYVTVDDLDLEIHLVKENEILNGESKSHQKFIHGIKVLMAKNYIDNLSEETRKGMIEKAEQGYYPSVAPMGYLNGEKKEGDKIIKMLVIDEQRAPIIQKLFRLYSTSDYSLETLTRIANEDGLRSKFGKKLHKSVINHILKNPIYTGDFIWCEKRYVGSHTPIITKALFDMVQDVFEDKNIPKPSKKEFPYTGLMLCGDCGCAITAEIKKGRYVYYHCTWHKPCNNKSYVKQEYLDEAFEHIVKNIHITDDALSLIKKSLIESHKDEADYHNRQISALNANYRLLKQRIDKIYIDKLDGKISENFYEEKVADWQKEAEEVSEKIERHKNADVNYLTQGVHILELANRAYSLYIKQKPAEKRKLLNILLSNCTLDGKNLIPQYKKPFDLLVKGLNSKTWLPG